LEERTKLSSVVNNATALHNLFKSFFESNTPETQQSLQQQRPLQQPLQSQHKSFQQQQPPHQSLQQQQQQQQLTLPRLALTSQSIQHHNGLQSTSLPLQPQQQSIPLCSTMLNVDNPNLRNIASPGQSRNNAADEQFLTPTHSIHNRSPPFTPIILNDGMKSPCPICPQSSKNAFEGRKGITQHFRFKHPNFDVKVKDMIFGFMPKILKN
jgi:hypothetical protein